MNTRVILKYAFLHAVGGALYVMGVSAFMMTVGDAVEGKNDIFGPVVFLLIFVVSASVMGSIVLLRPIFWYLDGKKKEAVKLLAYTLVFLALFAASIILFLLR